MILNERDTRKEHLVNVAKQMMTAIRTAPKGKGIDIIETVTITGKEIETLSKKTYQIGMKKDMKFFLRDSDNILSADAIVLLGTHQQVQGLNCAYCGYQLCASKPDEVPCAINSIDLGIAIGSACATAADFRVDSRVMFSVGLAAQELDLLKGCKCVIAIPISSSSKNPFFDRKPKII